MKIISFSFLLLLLVAMNTHDATQFPAIETEFPLIWKSQVGCVSFRSNVSFTDKDIFIGSNGESFYDYWINDPVSGIYVLDRKTGRRKFKFADEPLGDMDVNGILLYNGYCYFGNDNEEFLCTDMKGKIIWRQPASGDIEHEPVLIRAQGKDWVVYASELGEVKAVDPINGHTLWNYYTPDFSGFKSGDNRALFKVKAFFTNPRSFFTKPLLADLNHDGVNDLIYNTVSSDIYAINGANGKIIWIYTPGKNNSIYNVMHLTSVNGKPILSVIENGTTDQVKWSTSLLRINHQGKLIDRTPFTFNPESIGLNALDLGKGASVINTSDSLLILQDGLPQKSIFRKITYKEDRYASLGTMIENRNGRDPLFASATIQMPGYGRCMLILNQCDQAFWEHGFIEIVSLEKMEVVKRLTLQSRSEMPPVIKDVNGDGKLDLLVSCLDGNLYCYDLKLNLSALIK